MGAPRFLQECPCGLKEAAGPYCTRCLRPTLPSDVRRHGIQEHLGVRRPEPPSKELRRDRGVPEVLGQGGSRRGARWAALQEVA